MTHLQASQRGPDGGGGARLHYLDAMRSYLMLLGVVLHAARPYDSGGWLVKDASGDAVFDGVVGLVSLFRMPAFFVVAGYFAMLLLLRQPAAPFARERLRRTLVPTAAVLLTLNLYQTWWLHRGSVHDVGSFVRDALVPDWQAGLVLGHLWFLVYLAIYNLLVAVAAPTLRRIVASQRWQQASGDRRVFWLLAAGMVAYPLAWPLIARGAPELFDHVLFGLIDLMDLFGYLLFFVAGMLLYAFPALYRRFLGGGALLWIPMAAAGVGLLLASRGDAVLARAGQVAAGSLLVWVSVHVVFKLFRRFANRPSQVNRYLSDASYSVYLFHHLVVVVVVASLLLSTALAAWVKFAIVLTVASLLSLAVHHYLVRGHAPMRYLFNGRLGPVHRGTPGATATGPVRVPRRADASG